MIRGWIGWGRRADLWAGLVCGALAGLALWIGRGYPLGTSGRIGPGYAPRTLALLLLGLAALLVLRSLVATEQAEGGSQARPVVLVLAAVLAFSVTLAHAGLVPAILVSVAIATFATPENDWRTALVVGPLLALGSWFGGGKYGRDRYVAPAA